VPGEDNCLTKYLVDFHIKQELNELGQNCEVCISMIADGLNN